MLLWWRSRRGLPRGISPAAAAVALILAVTMIDMLLNATLVPLIWMCAGALLGHAEQLRASAPGRNQSKPLSPPKPEPLFGSGPVIGQRSDRRTWRK